MNEHSKWERTLKNKVNRGEFLRLSGSTALFLATSGLINPHCMGAVRTNQNKNNTESKADPEKISEAPILGALRTGIGAPNPHNTQAWKFRILNNNEALLYVDETRILTETDPVTRQIHIGQGTFLEHCRLGAQALGFAAEFRILPEGEYKIQDTGKFPAAHIVLKKQTRPQPVSYLYKAMAKRATNRTPYHGKWLSEKLFNEIVNSVNPGCGTFHYVPEELARAEHFPLLKKGFAVEMTTRAKNEESRKWFRLSDRDIQTKKDGITLQGNGISGLKLWLARTFFFSLDPEVYHSKESTGYAIDNFSNCLDSSAGLVYLKTAENRMRNWIECGMDYARFQLELTARSLVMQPMSQVLQEYVENEGVFEAYQELNHIKGPGKIQMIMRIGRSDYFFKSPRRDFTSMISEKTPGKREGEKQ